MKKQIHYIINYFMIGLEIEKINTKNDDHLSHTWFGVIPKLINIISVYSFIYVVYKIIQYLIYLLIGNHSLNYVLTIIAFIMLLIDEFGKTKLKIRSPIIYLNLVFRAAIKISVFYGIDLLASKYLGFLF